MYSCSIRGDNYRNGHRQLKVNNIAKHVGAGTGTAHYVGVPGTGVGNHYGHHGNYGHHGYGHGYGSHHGYSHGYHGFH